MTLRGPKSRSLRKSSRHLYSARPVDGQADEFAEHLPAQLTLQVNGEVHQISIDRGS